MECGCHSNLVNTLLHLSYYLSALPHAKTREIASREPTVLASVPRTRPINAILPYHLPPRKPSDAFSSKPSFALASHVLFGRWGRQQQFESPAPSSFSTPNRNDSPGGPAVWMIPFGCSALDVLPLTYLPTGSNRMEDQIDLSNPSRDLFRPSIGNQRYADELLGPSVVDVTRWTDPSAKPHKRQAAM